jgi:hypothetical protein
MLKILKFVKIRPMGAELFRADGRTDRMKKLIVASHGFAKAPTKLALPIQVLIIDGDLKTFVTINIALFNKLIFVIHNVSTAVNVTIFTLQKTVKLSVNLRIM